MEGREGGWRWGPHPTQGVEEGFLEEVVFMLSVQEEQESEEAREGNPKWKGKEKDKWRKRLEEPDWKPELTTEDLRSHGGSTGLSPSGAGQGPPKAMHRMCVCAAEGAAPRLEGHPVPWRGAGIRRAGVSVGRRGRPLSGATVPIIAGPGPAE